MDHRIQDGSAVDTAVMDLPERSELSTEARALLRTLLYFDLFDHPLRKEELLAFCDHPVPDANAALTELIRLGSAHTDGEFIAIGDVTTLAVRRAERSERANSRMAKARRMSRLIDRFPFVRGVLLSGSISKGVLAEDADIDYFVITRPGRLWVARTLLILYKKIFLLNSRRDFCLNYFIDTDHLEIEDQNLFTATELVTLVPMQGPAQCDALFGANDWAWSRFPNMSRKRPGSMNVHTGRIKQLCEKFLGGWLGSALDDLCMRLTFLYWRRKFSHVDARTFELAFRTRKYVSKHHPRNFQQRVIDALGERITRFDQEHGIDIR